MRTFRGWKALVHDTVDGVVDLVGEGHESTARAVMRGTDFVAPLAEPARMVDALRRVSTRGVLETIKAVNRIVEAATDAGLELAVAAAEAEPGEEDPVSVPLRRAVVLRSDAMLSPEVASDAAIGLVNGSVGDRLASKRNGLDMGMVFRVRDHYVDPDDAESFATSLRAAFATDARPPGPRVALFVHGLATTEWSWVLEAASYHGDPAATFGSLLERDLGVTPIYLRYNTGRRIPTNGRALAAALEAFVASYPATLEELVLVGHSMGGLVIRSACHYGVEGGHTWVGHVRRVFCLGSPHQGAPLERVGGVLTSALSSVDLPGTVIPARILERRSAGIRDLRRGTLVDAPAEGAADGETEFEVPLLPNVTYSFVASTVTQDVDHPLGRLIGDLLVQMPSGSGPRLQETTFPIELERFGGILHHQLQNHPAVYEVLRRGCSRTDSE